MRNLLLAFSTILFLLSSQRAISANLIGKFEQHEYPVSSIVQISQLGTPLPLALSADTSGSVILWDISTKAIKWRANAATTGKRGITFLSLSASGDFFTVLKDGVPLAIRHVSDGNIKTTFHVPSGLKDRSWLSAAFSSSNRLFAASNWSGQILIFDSATGQLKSTINELAGNSEEPTGFIIGFTHDENFMTVIEKNGAHVIDVNTGKVIKSVEFSSQILINFGKFSNDLRLLAIADQENYLIYDTQTLKVLQTISKSTFGHRRGSYTSNLEFDRSNQNLYTWSFFLESPWPGAFEAMNVTTGEKVKSVYVTESIFSPDIEPGVFLSLSTLIPESGLLLSGTKDPNDILIWKL
jgi:hypothetical protein